MDFQIIFYRSYHKINPSSADSNHRKLLYMLYHYLNHLNIPKCDELLPRFIGY